MKRRGLGIEGRDRRAARFAGGRTRVWWTGTQANRPDSGEKKRLSDMLGKLGSSPTSQEPEFGRGSLRPAAGSAAAGEVPQARRKAAPARGAAASRPSPDRWRQPGRKLRPSGPGRRGGRRAAGEVRTEPGGEVCSPRLARFRTAGGQSDVTREPRLGGNKTPASHPCSPD